MFSKSDYSRRISAAQSMLPPKACLLVGKGENLRYFTGVDSGRLLIWDRGTRFWLNPVYGDRARRSPVRPLEPKKDAVSDFILKKGFTKLLVDKMSLSSYLELKPRLRRITRPSDICSRLRMIKDRREIRLLAKAGRIASDAMRAAGESELAGLSEFELAASIEFNIRGAGSEKPPFGMGMLCLSGPNTRFPHAPPSSRIIRGGDLVILDLGAVYEGYHSDMTRTLAVGALSQDKRSISDFMDWLKESAIDMVEIGGKISEIHEYIEKEIKKKGYNFAHLSGHGVGLEIHESPSVGPSCDDTFQDGMVFTIEPGIYTASFGARSEDTIALVNGKKKILTRF